MAAVRGGVDHKVLTASAHAAFQNRLERGKIVIIGRKTQIVNEQDELQRVLRQRVHQTGHLVKLVLLDFDKAKPLTGKLVGDGLDSTGLAGARIAVKKHVVGGLAGQQGAGVGNNLFALPLVARQFVKTLRVGVADRNQFAVLHRKDVILRKDAVAFFADLGQPGTERGRVIEGGNLPSGRQQRGKALPAGAAFQQIGKAHGAGLLQDIQFPGQIGFGQCPRTAAGGFSDADVLILHDGIQQHGAPVAPEGQQRGFKRGSGLHKGGTRRIGAVQRPPGRQHGAERSHRFPGQQAAEHHQPAQASLQFTQIFHIPIFPLGKNLFSV